MQDIKFLVSKYTVCPKYTCITISSSQNNKWNVG